MDKLKKIAEKIKNLEIQGATNVAFASVEAIAQYSNRLPLSLSKEKFLKKIHNAIRTIRFTRPTEPAMQNGLRKIEFEIQLAKHESTEKINEKIGTTVSTYTSLLISTKEQIIDYGADLIQTGYTVMTHCHSSACSETIIKAFNDGKDIKAIATETRPKYQGRKTALELVNAGIPTTQVVDSAMRWAIKKQNVDMVLIGMDAITSIGTVINKIGSRLLSLAAKESDVPFFISGSLLKFDSDTLFGKRTEMENRETTEITQDWDKIPKNLKILNPAFESISRNYITGLICEIGIFAPELVFKLVQENYPFILSYNRRNN